MQGLLPMNKIGLGERFRLPTLGGHTGSFRLLGAGVVANTPEN